MQIPLKTKIRIILNNVPKNIRKVLKKFNIPIICKYNHGKSHFKKKKIMLLNDESLDDNVIKKLFSLNAKL